MTPAPVAGLNDGIDVGHPDMSLTVFFRLGGVPTPGPPPSMYQPQGRRQPPTTGSDVKLFPGR